MAKEIYCCLLLLGALVSFGSGVFPTGIQSNSSDTIDFDLSQRPSLYTGDSTQPGPVERSEPDISHKFGKLTRSINNLVWKTSGAGTELGGDKGQRAKKALELRVKCIEEVEAKLEIYQEKLNALSDDTRKSGVKAEQGTKQERNKAELIRRLVENSTIQFYRNANFTEAHKPIKVGRPEELGSCKNLEQHLERKHGGSVAALETFGTCVRLFKDKSCAGKSFAIYPGHTLNLSQILPEIDSVGPCYKHEFDYSNITQTPQGLLYVVKDTGNYREIPSALIALETDSCGGEAAQQPGRKFMHSVDTASIIVRDCSSRPSMFIRSVRIGEIKSKDLSSNYLSETWKSMEKESGDIMGYFMPPYLGGGTADPANIFPQSLENFDAWNKVTERLVDYLVENQARYLTLFGTLVYQSKEAKRPHGLHWAFNLDRSLYYPLNRAPWTAYGYIPN